MAAEVSWVLQAAVKDGKLEDFRSLMDEMVDATKGEDGAQIYEWFLSADGSAVHIYERYADSAATMVHLGNFGANFAERFLGCVDPTGLAVYGEPSADVKGVLDGFGAAYYGTLGGFAR